MAMDISPVFSWKNKRKKSLYVEEADMGFIFRKVSKPSTEKKGLTPTSNGVLQPPLLNGSSVEPELILSAHKIDESGERGFDHSTSTRLEADSKNPPILVNGHGEDVITVDDDNGVDANTSQESAVSLDTSLVQGELGGEEFEEELHKDVELKRFIAQLRKEILTGGGATSEEEVDKVLNDIRRDLKQSGLYFKYMQENGPDELLPHPLTEQLREHIDTLKASIEQHRRELNDWNELLERQRLEVEQSKRNCESNKNINYSYLRSEDIAALKTYLTPDQLNLLDQPSSVDPAFTQQASSRLKDIHSKLDRDMDEARGKCHEATEWLKSSAFGTCIDDSSTEETPRTVFKALKKTII